MSVQRLMSSPVITVEPDDTLEEVRHIFHNTRFHHLPVKERGVLVGMVSDRDLFKALSPWLDTAAENQRDLMTLKKRVHQIMNRKPRTVHESASVPEAIQVIFEQEVSCVVVVAAGAKPVGILTWRDILRELMRVRRSRSSG